MKQTEQHKTYISIILASVLVSNSWLFFEVIQALQTYLPKILRVQSMQSSAAGVLFSVILFFIFSAYGVVYEMLISRSVTEDKTAKSLFFFLIGAAIYFFIQLLMTFLVVRGFI